MQTFIPYGPYFAMGAQALDMKRLGKQRVEAWQILNTLRGVSKGWANHPAVKMWAGYETALITYGIVHCNEWINRGYKDTLMPRFMAAVIDSELIIPTWLEDKYMQETHRSNLIRKFPDHYGPLWPDTPPNLPYVWPV